MKLKKIFIGSKGEDTFNFSFLKQKSNFKLLANIDKNQI